MSNIVKFNNSIKGSGIRSARQVEKLINTNYSKLKWFLSSRQDFLNGHLLKLDGELSSVGRVFNFLVGRFNVYPVLFFKQETIARELGLCRQTVNVAISELKKCGLINSIYRTNNTCLYGLPSYFRETKVRRSLSNMFSSFKCITLALLLSGATCLSSEKQNKLIMEKVTNTKEIKYKYNKSLRNNKEYRLKNNLKIETSMFSGRKAQKRTGGLRPIGSILKSITGLVTNTSKNITIDRKRDVIDNSKTLDIKNRENTMKKSFEQVRYDELLQKSIPEDDIDKIKRKLALITEANKQAAWKLGFSKAGQVSAAIFPDVAIKYATMNTLKHISGEDRFKSFFKMCKFYCTHNNIHIHPTLLQSMHELFKIDINKPKVRINIIVAPKTRTTYEQRRKQYKDDYKVRQGESKQER